ncbi:ACP S-malonyltransferase [Sphaerisporangium dianthi]|uniref:[acyl-carrier-protein] S-malonyltransferase n=1 Tax=Sphaerisporangium dianthi TaxID=1436120 RepID=A0ABV9CSG7_9ACTN
MHDDLRPGTAIVFPGMGPSRFEDVARFMLINPFARRLVAEADEVLGYSLVDRFEEAEGDYTEYAQVAFLVNCLALAQWGESELGVGPAYCVGPSFGGKAAAVYSGALPFRSAVSMTARWARVLEDYFTLEHRDVVTHSFARTGGDRLAGILADLDERGEWYDISCYVDHDFHMVSLREGMLDWLQERLRALGGLPLYTMRPPMHSSAFRPLRDRVAREILDGVDFADPVVPIVADQDARLVTSGAGVREMLLDGFVEPVRWPAVVAELMRLGVGKLYVSGPDALFGRVACTTENFEVVAITPRTALRPRRRVAV